MCACLRVRVVYAYARDRPLPQAIWVQLGGDFLQTCGLSSLHWGYAIGLSLLSFPIGVLMRLIPVKDRESDLAGYVYNT